MLPDARRGTRTQAGPDADPADIVDATAEALLYLATKHKQAARYDEAQANLAKLLDYGGPEKLEAAAMLREIRALADDSYHPGL